MEERIKVVNHYEESMPISADAKQIFSFIDDHKRFSSHMSKSSLMMVGSKMNIVVDKGMGQKIGSHIKLDGSIFGIKLFVDEVVTVYKPPYRKEWETVGTPRLLVIGDYKMKVDIKPKKNNSQLTVSIDYDLPKKNIWMGKIFGAWYARWCVRQMLDGVKTNF